MKCLIMGLPGSGKSYLANLLRDYFTAQQKSVTWFNADTVRKTFNDWDFSTEGRLRQADRMRTLADSAQSDVVLVDFVAPLPEMRTKFDPDWTIWMDTISESRFADTNAVFVQPTQYDFRITEQNGEKWAEYIGSRILAGQRRPVFDWSKPTVQQLGRFQPWHAGHRALFERLLQRTGQVVIQVRDTYNTDKANPFTFDEVQARITQDLDPLYQGQYQVQRVPNVVHIGYGRDVGYTIAKEEFTEDVTSVSATSIRRSMGLA